MSEMNKVDAAGVRSTGIWWRLGVDGPADLAEIVPCVRPAGNHGLEVVVTPITAPNVRPQPRRTRTLPQ